MPTFSFYIKSKRKDLEGRQYGTAEDPHRRMAADVQDILDGIANRAHRYKYGVPAQVVPFSAILGADYDLDGDPGDPQADPPIPPTPAITENDIEDRLRQIQPEWYYIDNDTDLEVKPTIDMQAETVTVTAQYDVVIWDASSDDTSADKLDQAKAWARANWADIRNHSLTNAKAQQAIHALFELMRGVYDDLE